MTCPVHEPVQLPNDRGFLTEPLPELLRLQREEPVRKVRFPNGVDGWLLSGYEYFRTMLNDPRFSNRREELAPGLREAALETAPGGFARADGEDHQYYRRMLTKEFMVKR